MTNPRQLLLTLTVAFALGGLSSANSAAASYDAEWRFKVLLNGKPIGFHNFNLTQDGARQTLTTEASFDVKFLFINAFRYRHDNVEVWSDGCLESIYANTDNNGDFFSVRGERYDEVMRVTGTTGPQLLDRCVQTFAYWNPSILSSSKLLNSQTGEVEEVSVTLESADVINVNGEDVEAVRYVLSAKSGAITLWYSNDDSKRWLALEAPAKGGRSIRYVPVQIPAAADLVA